MTTQERTSLLEQIQEEIKQLSLEGQLELLEFLSTQLRQKAAREKGSNNLQELPEGVKAVRLDSSFNWLADPADDLYSLEDGDPFNPEDYRDVH